MSSSQQRFVTLDGLRGMAALIVMFGHTELGSINYWNASVDLFFCLSGFVLAHAYAKKLENNLTLGRFLWLRFVRLYPLYAVGLLIGAAAKLGSEKLGACVILGLLGIPVWIQNMPTWALGMLYPVDPPAWSLFDEALVNVAFAIFLIRGISVKWLFIVGSIAAIIYTFIYKHSLMNGGWDTANFWVGFIRVGFSFPLGVLLYQNIHTKLPSLNGWLILAAVFIFMSIPSSFGHQPAVALLLMSAVYPLAILLGATASAGSFSSRLFAWLGGISYAIYVIHMPLIWSASRLGFSPLIGCAFAVPLAHWLTYHIDPAIRRLFA